MYSTEANATVSYLPELEGSLTTLPAASNESTFEFYYKGMSHDIFFYGMCVVGPFGLMGNLLALYVFLRSSSLRKTTTGQWLVALAIADSTVLVGEILRWLTFLGLDIDGKYLYYIPPSSGLNALKSAAGCKITYFLRYSGGLCSAWITVAIAVERLIAVAWPLKIISISTPRRVQILIASIGVGGLALGLFPFWTVNKRDETDGPHCRIENSTAYKIWNNIVIKSFTLAIPSVLITAFTVVIIGLLYRARKRRKARLSASIRSHQLTTARMISVEAQLTILLVAVCVSTIALRTPYTIAYNIRTMYWDVRPSVEIEVVTYFAYRLTDLINIINYAVNFLLYCLCGSSFRKECAQLLYCSKKDDQIPVKCLGVWGSYKMTTLNKETT